MSVQTNKDEAAKAIEDRFQQIVAADLGKQESSKLVLIVVVVIIIAATLGGGYYYYNMKNGKLKGTTAREQQSPKQIIASQSGDKLKIPK